jgi:hypothetical protein
LPLTHVILFLLVTTAPVNITVAVDETGISVDVPAWVAVTAQFPPVSRFKVDPVTEQIPVEVVEKVTTAPLDAVAVSASDLLEIFEVLGRVNEIVCGSLVTSNDTLYRSDAKYVAVSPDW